jgi:hypothetical protein
MVSPGRLFNTPPGVRMSPGKKRVLWGPAPNLKSVHSALTRVSAALAESRNLHRRMMESEERSRNMEKLYQKHINEWVRLHELMKRNPSAAINRKLHEARVRINAAKLSSKNIRRKGDKIADEWERAVNRYRQLARRVVHHNGSRNLNSRPLTQREKEAIRVSGAIVRNMSAARRTVRHLPLPRNMGHLVIRASARR